MENAPSEDEASRRVNKTRSDADHGNVSIPSAALTFLDKWLESADARNAGIRSRRDFVITVYEILLKKMDNIRYVRDLVDYAPTSNVTIPRKLSDRLHSVAGKTYATKALWLPRKTSILSFILQDFLAQHDEEYKELVEQLRISLDDIKGHKHLKIGFGNLDSKKTDTNETESIRSLLSIEVERITPRCRIGEHSGCKNGVWCPDLEFPNEIVICTCPCHSKTKPTD